MMVQRDGLFSDRPATMPNPISIAVDNKHQEIGHLKNGVVDGRCCSIVSGLIGLSISINTSRYPLPCRGAPPSLDLPRACCPWGIASDLGCLCYSLLATEGIMSLCPSSYRP